MIALNVVGGIILPRRKLSDPYTAKQSSIDGASDAATVLGAFLLSVCAFAGYLLG
jgi:hypothetical protein